MSNEDLQELQTELARIRALPEVQSWSHGAYPDIELPEGYGFSYNRLSGKLIVIETRNIGVPYMDPKYETYHCM